MHEGELRCPSCTKRVKLEIKDDLIKNFFRGLIRVGVTPRSICPRV